MPNTVSTLANAGQIVVVGAQGRMGQMLLREAKNFALPLQALSYPWHEEDFGCLTNAALVILCVPARNFIETLETICPFLAPSAILCDITSVKVNPLRQMAQYWDGEIVGTHPLFGPNPDRSQELPVAIMPGKRCSEESLDTVERFFRYLAFSPFRTDADSHDRAMARIQNMNFITSLAYCAQTADDELLRPFLTPSFLRRLSAAKKMLTEDGDMFSGLFEANPYSQEAVRQFSKLLSLASAGDIDLLLDRARHWWKA